jgi:DNA invertase Pin-like site-specific DNA recombinase
MRAAIYLRISTAEQTTDNQERELRAAAARMGHDVVEVPRSRRERLQGPGQASGVRQSP